MNMSIRAIVYAKAKEDALTKAVHVFEKLTNELKVFDRFSLLLESNKEILVCSADSKLGQQMIEEGLEESRQAFMKAFGYVRLAVEHMTPEEIMEEEPPSHLDSTIAARLRIIRYYFAKVGEYRGPTVTLYDEKADGIRNSKILKEVLNGVTNGELVWVIPADMHF
jgi:hypothetical protein